MSRPSTYSPPTFPAAIDLDLSRNEGRPWSLESSRAAAEGRLIGRYPDVSGLRAAIAGRHGVDPARVLVTAGGDDALLRCFMSRAGRVVVSTTPSFEMIRRYAEQTGSPLVEIPWWTGEFPIDEFFDSEGEMAVVVSPNNPTGSTMTGSDLKELADSFPLVVLDAAYADFDESDLTDEALALDGVVVVRTLSKAYGLAGLRIGYLLGGAETVSEIAAFGSPFSVSGLSASIAQRALEADTSPKLALLTRIDEERGRLTDVLDELGARPLPSRGNFVLASDVDAEWMVAAAASLGIGLRRFPDRPDLERCVRITMPGDAGDFARLESGLRSILAPEALLFDLDGVLADVSGSYRRAIVETASRLGVEVGHAEIAAEKASGNANDDFALTWRLCSRAGVDVGLDRVTEIFQSIYHGAGPADGLKHSELPLVGRETLLRLASRLPLAVVTGRPGRDAEEFLSRTGLADCFAEVVAREDAPLKPDPGPVRLAMRRLGVSHAWMVGDTPDDIVAARGAGVVPIGYMAPDATDDRSSLSGAAQVLDSLERIEEILDAQNI